MIAFPRWRSVLFAILALVPVLAVSSTAAASGIERIRQKGVLTVAMFAEDVPPFFYANAEGALVGIDPMLAGGIAAKLGVRVVFDRSATTFDGVIDEVVTGRADIAVSLLSNTLERAMRVSFSRSYVSVRQFLLINRLELGQLVAGARGAKAGAPVPRLLDDPVSHIGVIGGTSYVGFLKEDFPTAQAVEFDSWDPMLAAVKSGRLVALLYDEIEIGNWRLADPAGSLELRPYHLVGHPDPIAIAVQQGDVDLKAWVDLYLDKMEANGQLATLLKTYLYSGDRLLTND
ncbi:hypothetical protein C3941_04785 [Kaistia algarum]|uniref:substrate-binding periplasmic protein n=1 Tax=Kaistia algarum TaxID=2083279 RepID=UPI000CE8A48E|nr:ABC transporter substrate-binding protein [Kaistia algarum]MCX5516003.1 ABC transporter substrate-binding protein [Kaistia algarum]PPE80643.1 hypothetical protein C3941_04785 [Kaistia algarum]